jgi:hypothetical protein
LGSIAVPNFAGESYLKVRAPFYNKPSFKNFKFIACIFSETGLLQYLSWIIMYKSGPMEGSSVEIMTRCEKCKITDMQFQQEL